jgi:hypothetical protein
MVNDPLRHPTKKRIPHFGPLKGPRLRRNDKSSVSSEHKFEAFCNSNNLSVGKTNYIER